jgi:hypothetical protein
MLNIKKFLLPVDVPMASLVVIHQAAALARHFNSEIVMLHVATALRHAVGVPEDSRSRGPHSSASFRWHRVLVDPISCSDS